MFHKVGDFVMDFMPYPSLGQIVKIEKDEYNRKVYTVLHFLGDFQEYGLYESEIEDMKQRFQEYMQREESNA